MQKKEQSDRGSFGRLGFILAATGSAVGLGNLWKFPYMTYQNEGGSFVLVYLVSVLLIGAPLMMAEILVGRRTKKNSVQAVRELARESGRSGWWGAVGWLGIIGGFVILSYYSVVAGWTVYYVGKCIGWSLGQFDPATVAPGFGAFVSNGWAQVGFHALFMTLTMGVVLGGVQGGIERVTTILMPLLGLLLAVLAFNSCFQPGFSRAIGFLFSVGPIGLDGVLEAIGQSFFSLSLGMGAMITYGSYVAKHDSIPRAALTVVLFDTLVGFMACVIMTTIIFSADASVSFGKSAAILFTTMPVMFYRMSGGALLAPLFYFLVAAAALSSTISLLEVVVAYFIDNLGWSRKKGVWVVGSLIFLLGVPAALSNGATEWFSVPWGEDHTGKAAYLGFFDLMDYLATNWMLPSGALLLSIFVGWFVQAKFTRAELEVGHGKLSTYVLWHWTLRIVCPLAVGAIIVAVLTGRTFT